MESIPVSTIRVKSLQQPRTTYAPFEYPRAYEFWEKQASSHWLHTEINMASDVHDWKTVLSPAERNLIGHVLKGFVQSEIVIQDYWSSMVSRWFPKPEIGMMATTFASFENIHTASYAQLNDSLGLHDFDAFLQEPTAKAKIDRLVNTRGDSARDIALSLAIFSAFNEGVNLFSSFAILLNFSRFNKLKGVGQIIAFSIKDESLHAEAGCWLFRTFVAENPGLLDDSLKQEIYDAARLTVALEDAFIAQAYSVGSVEGLTEYDMRHFIRHRANTKLHDLGLDSLWRDVDKAAVDRMAWFDVLSAGVAHADFFASRVTDYAKGTLDFSDVWSDQVSSNAAE